MAFYILTSEIFLENKLDIYKIGITKTTESELLSAYSRGCPCVKILHFERRSDNEVLESYLKKMFDNERCIISVTQSKQEWIKSSLSDIRKKIKEFETMKDNILNISVKKSINIKPSSILMIDDQNHFPNYRKNNFEKWQHIKEDSLLSIYNSMKEIIEISKKNERISHKKFTVENMKFFFRHIFKDATISGKKDELVERMKSYVNTSATINEGFLFYVSYDFLIILSKFLGHDIKHKNKLDIIKYLNTKYHRNNQSNILPDSLYEKLNKDRKDDIIDKITIEHINELDEYELAYLCSKKNIQVSNDANWKTLYITLSKDK